MADLWFLDVLGLSALADETAVRRAYAVALRGIDPATNPLAFARLRVAYEEARRWCASEEASASGQHMAPTGDPLVEMVGSSAEDAMPVVEPDEARKLVETFVDTLTRCGPDDIPALLVTTVAGLRTQYIDAPGQFEEHLIDLLGAQALRHRPVLFDAAGESFHWDEIGHLNRLGERGAWVERVISERIAWQRLAESRQMTWLALFASAESDLRREHISQWPSIAPLLPTYPTWIGLHVTAETLERWRARFEAMDAHDRENAARSAPGRAAYLPARPRRDKAKRSPLSALLMAFAFMVFAMIIVRIILGIL
jgi:hypothetical protein